MVVLGRRLVVAGLPGSASYQCPAATRLQRIERRLLQVFAIGSAVRTTRLGHAQVCVRTTAAGEMVVMHTAAQEGVQQHSECGNKRNDRSHDKCVCEPRGSGANDIFPGKQQESCSSDLSCRHYRQRPQPGPVVPQPFRRSASTAPRRSWNRLTAPSNRWLRVLTGEWPRRTGPERFSIGKRVPAADAINSGCHPARPIARSHEVATAHSCGRKPAVPMPPKPGAAKRRQQCHRRFRWFCH